MPIYVFRSTPLRLGEGVLALPRRIICTPRQTQGLVFDIIPSPR